jgi:hypothetical protein
MARACNPPLRSARGRLTRSRYRRRRYESVYCDDDFTLRAGRDGVHVPALDLSGFVHRHPVHGAGGAGAAQMHGTTLRNNAGERYQRGAALFRRRAAESAGPPGVPASWADAAAAAAGSDGRPGATTASLVRVPDAAAATGTALVLSVLTAVVCGGGPGPDGMPEERLAAGAREEEDEDWTSAGWARALVHCIGSATAVRRSPAGRLVAALRSRGGGVDTGRGGDTAGSDAPCAGAAAGAAEALILLLHPDEGPAAAMAAAGTVSTTVAAAAAAAAAAGLNAQIDAAAGAWILWAGGAGALDSDAAARRLLACGLASAGDRAAAAGKPGPVSVLRRVASADMRRDGARTRRTSGAGGETDAASDGPEPVPRAAAALVRYGRGASAGGGDFTGQVQPERDSAAAARAKLWAAAVQELVADHWRRMRLLARAAASHLRGYDGAGEDGAGECDTAEVGAEATLLTGPDVGGGGGDGDAVRGGLEADRAGAEPGAGLDLAKESDVGWDDAVEEMPAAAVGATSGWAPLLGRPPDCDRLPPCGGCLVDPACAESSLALGRKEDLNADADDEGAVPAVRLFSPTHGGIVEFDAPGPVGLTVRGWVDWARLGAVGGRACVYLDGVARGCQEDGGGGGDVGVEVGDPGLDGTWHWLTLSVLDADDRPLQPAAVAGFPTAHFRAVGRRCSPPLLLAVSQQLGGGGGGGGAGGGGGEWSLRRFLDGLPAGGAGAGRWWPPLCVADAADGLRGLDCSDSLRQFAAAAMAADGGNTVRLFPTNPKGGDFGGSGPAGTDGMYWAAAAAWVDTGTVAAVRRAHNYDSWLADGTLGAAGWRPLGGGEYLLVSRAVVLYPAVVVAVNDHAASSNETARSACVGVCVLDLRGGCDDRNVAAVTASSGATVALPQAVLLAQVWGEAFYHWMVECLPRLAALPPAAWRGPGAAVIVARPSPFVTETLLLLGVPRSGVLGLAHGSAYAVDQLWVPPPGECGVGPAPRFLRRLARRLAASLAVLHQLPNAAAAAATATTAAAAGTERRCMLVQREWGSRGARVLLNEDVLLAALDRSVMSERSRITPTRCSRWEIFRPDTGADGQGGGGGLLAAGAAWERAGPVVVAAHGGAVSNMLFWAPPPGPFAGDYGAGSSPRRGLLEILPEHRPNLCYALLARALGVEYRGLVVASAALDAPFRAPVALVVRAALDLQASLAIRP